MYEDNTIMESDESELETLKEFSNNCKLFKNFFPLMTYDMVQCGYPYSNHGIMVARAYGGTNEEHELIDGNGMWCKVSDVKKYLEQLNEK